MGIFDAAGVFFSPMDFVHSKNQMSSESLTDQRLPDKESATMLDGYSDVGEIVMLVTILRCWSQNFDVGGIFGMLMPDAYVT